MNNKAAFYISIFWGKKMKRLIGERRSSSGCTDGALFKDRRKAYYHGKYSKRMFSVLFVASFIIFLMVKQGA